MTIPSSHRATETGVTLIEMLVVLTLFAIIAGAIVLALPSDRPGAQRDLDLLTLDARVEAAVDRTLSSGTGFAIWQDRGDIIFLEQGRSGRWVTSSDPRLNPVKLSARGSRMSFGMDDDRVFAVSAALVPVSGTPLRVVAGDGSDLWFDGLQIKREQAGRDEDAAQ
ncbi:MAG: type II secretion system protein [Pseudomonadota bacterium]